MNLYCTVLEEVLLAGAAGFEPANADTKNQCLTPWRRPISKSFITISCYKYLIAFYPVSKLASRLSTRKC